MKNSKKGIALLSAMALTYLIVRLSSFVKVDFRSPETQETNKNTRVINQVELSVDEVMSFHQPFIDNENIEYLLNFDSEEETKEFVEAIQKFNLVKFSDSKKVFYLSDYSQFIGSNKKSKSSRKNKEDKDDSQTSPEYEALTDSQKRMYNQAKAKGYKGSVQDFISGKDSEEIDKLISNNKGINKSQIKEEVDNGKSFFDE